VIYVLRPDLDSLTKAIAQKYHQGHDGPESYFMFVPRRTIECDELLDQHDLLNSERILYVALDLI
jgi:hypothetical protein